MEARESLVARDAVLHTVRKLIVSDPRVARAFQSLSRASKANSETELALGLMCCLWETSRGLPNRFGAVCDGLAGGLTIEQLFPNSFRERHGA